MTIRSALSSAVIFAGVAAALAGPARADQAIFEGDYTFTGGGVTRPWHATPCGVGYPCTHIDAPPAVGKAGFGGDAHIANVPFWIMTVMGVPDAVGNKEVVVQVTLERSVRQLDEGRLSWGQELVKAVITEAVGSTTQRSRITVAP